MLIKAAQLEGAKCPFRDGRTCMGESCALWRWHDLEHGFCGPGGPHRERMAPVMSPAKPPEAPQPDATAQSDLLGRVDRQTTKGTAPRKRT